MRVCCGAFRYLGEVGSNISHLPSRWIKAGVLQGVYFPLFTARGDKDGYCVNRSNRQLIPFSWCAVLCRDEAILLKIAQTGAFQAFILSSLEAVMHIQPQRCVLLELQKPFPATGLWRILQSAFLQVSRDPPLLILEHVYVFLVKLLGWGGWGFKVDSLKSQACGYFQKPRSVRQWRVVQMHCQVSGDARPPVPSQCACWATRGLIVPKQRAKHAGSSHEDWGLGQIQRNTKIKTLNTRLGLETYYCSSP